MRRSPVSESSSAILSFSAGVGGAALTDKFYRRQPSAVQLPDSPFLSKCVLSLRESATCLA